MKNDTHTVNTKEWSKIAYDAYQRQPRIEGNLKSKTLIVRNLKTQSPFDIGTNITLLEQNPTKSSNWAWLARHGKEVIQVLVRPNSDNELHPEKTSDYYGVYIEGTFHRYTDNDTEKLKDKIIGLMKKELVNPQ